MIENRNRLLGVLLAAVLVALGVLAYLYYERTKPVAHPDLPGKSPARSPRKAWISRSASQRTNRQVVIHRAARCARRHPSGEGEIEPTVISSLEDSDVGAADALFRILCKPSRTPQ